MSKDQKDFTWQWAIDLGWASRSKFEHDLLHMVRSRPEAHKFRSITGLLVQFETMESSPLIILYTSKENAEESNKLRSLIDKTGLKYEEQLVDQGTR
jgi:hypothetical protein